MPKTSEWWPGAMTASAWRMSMGASDRDSEANLRSRDLIARAVGGDRDAFEQIVIDNERRVLMVAWRMLGRMDQAEDAAQEAFLRAYRYLHRIDPDRPFTPWLMRITINVCHDLRRRRQKSEATFGDGHIVENIPGRIGGPDVVLAQDERRRLLWAALDALPAKERAAIVLRDLEGLSTAEVAEALDSSPATVRSQISSARLKIRRKLDKGKK